MKQVGQKKDMAEILNQMLFHTSTAISSGVLIEPMYVPQRTRASWRACQE